MVEPITYKDAGVDIDRVTSALKSVSGLVRSTHTADVLTGLGSFGALFRPDFSGMQEPVLVASTDGVGTKLMVARRAERYHTVGADLVNHCINDILVMGARPLFFLDYVAAGHFPEGRVEEIVGGFANACKAEAVALIGGETAEMPGLYSAEDFDLAGFIVGVLDRKAALLPERVQVGDLLIGLHSSGLHTNGYSLAQRVLFDRAGLDVGSELPGVDGTLGDALLAVHRCYLKPLSGLLEHPGLRVMSHITGGGFTDNIPRVLPEGVDAVVDRSSWQVPALFREIARRGPVTRAEMDRTFNMGIGMVLVIDPSRVDEVEAHLREQGELPCRMGRIEAGTGVVRYEGPEEL